MKGTLQANGFQVGSMQGLPGSGGQNKEYTAAIILQFIQYQ